MKKYISKGMLVAAALLTSSITTSVMGMDFMVPNLAFFDFDDTPAAPQKSAATTLQNIKHQLKHNVSCEWNKEKKAYVPNWAFKDAMKEEFSTLLAFGTFSDTNPEGLTNAQTKKAYNYATHLGLALEASMFSGPQSTVNPFKTHGMASDPMTLILSFATPQYGSINSTLCIAALVNGQMNGFVQPTLNDAKKEHVAKKEKEEQERIKKEEEGIKTKTLINFLDATADVPLENSEQANEFINTHFDQLSQAQALAASLDPSLQDKEDFDNLLRRLSTLLGENPQVLIDELKSAQTHNQHPVAIPLPVQVQPMNNPETTINHFVEIIAEPIMDALFGSEDGATPPTMTKEEAQEFLISNAHLIGSAQESAIASNNPDCIEYIQSFINQLNDLANS